MFYKKMAPIQSQILCANLAFRHYMQWFLRVENKNITKMRKQQNLCLQQSRIFWL
jgi:hypothetical protein